MMLLAFKICASLFITMATGVFIGNTMWNYNIAIMPWWFKWTLGLVAVSFFISLFTFIFIAIWTFPWV